MPWIQPTLVFVSFSSFLFHVAVHTEEDDDQGQHDNANKDYKNKLGVSLRRPRRFDVDVRSEDKIIIVSLRRDRLDFFMAKTFVSSDYIVCLFHVDVVSKYE
jgi:hypothetical protein